MTHIPGFDGRCNVMWVGDQIEIQQSDPRVSIAGDLLRRVQDGYGHPSLALDRDVLTIHGTNRTAGYVIGEYDSERDAYPAQWPD